jgi:hypothetical protein
MPVSDRYGRAFEYCIANAIFLISEKLCPGKVKLTSRAENMQLTGQTQFRALDSGQRKHFEGSGRKISEWLANNKLKDFKPTEIRAVEIDRIPDIAGVKGDVTDIRIRLSLLEKNPEIVNISLKHRHEALKHPRLTRIPEWIGLAKTRAEQQYLKNYDYIWVSFFQKGKKLAPNAERFRDLKAIDPAFIEENLYEPLYNLVADFLKKNIKSPSQVQEMFDFLVGKFSYIKFVDQNGKIEVRDFSNIPKTSTVTIEYKKGGYLHLQFNNGWIISGRLHTATEWLKKSIKFDIQPNNLDSALPAIYI